MKYGLIVFHDTFNFGDDIQSYAAERYLPHTDYLIERERLDEFYTETGEQVGVILSGWFLYEHLHWPPSPFMKTLPVSMHFDTFYSRVAGERLTRNFVLEDYGAEWLIENGPVGSRDLNTKRLLDKAGIPGYFSGCLTLTVPQFADASPHGKICLVDVPKRTKEFIYKRSNTEILELSHSIKMNGIPWEKRRRLVEKRLKLYQGASLVVTSRLHAALPCLALGTPVLLIQEEWSLNRIGTWLDYLNYTPEEKLLSGEFSYDFDAPKENPESYQEIAEKLKESCTEFIRECEAIENVPKLDVAMFIDGKKRVNRLQKLMKLRTDKFERELHGH